MEAIPMTFKRIFALMLMLALCVLAGSALAETTTYIGNCGQIIVSGTGDQTIMLDNVNILICHLT